MKKQTKIILTVLWLIMSYFLFDLQYNTGGGIQPNLPSILFLIYRSLIALILLSFIWFWKPMKKVLRIVLLVLISLSIIGFGYSMYISAKNSSEVIYAKKPMIYLYPTEEQNISVTLGNPEDLTHTYPKYVDEWNVSAQPNGILTDESGRKYYGLYWEGVDNREHNHSDGFIVKGEDTIAFLEEKLAILGLNEIEANEFIIYWLPKLENNEYNFIRFQEQAEIDGNMPLTITPTPDSIIRIMMEYKPINNPQKVNEQTLTSPARKGFTAVEWGGTEIR